jgi:protein TonB
MDYGAEPKLSRNTVISIGLVILLHVLLVYAIVSGLATSVIAVVKKPLETKIISAPPPPPPPPPPVVLPPPTLAPPPPPYVPPPLIQVQQPPQQVFAVTTQVKPPAPTPTAPKAAPSTNVTVVCPNVGTVASQLQDQFGQISDTTGINSGHVTVQFTISPDGAVSNATVVSSSSPVLNGMALSGTRALSCRGQGQTVTVIAPFEFQAQ